MPRLPLPQSLLSYNHDFSAQEYTSSTTTARSSGVSSPAPYPNPAAYLALQPLQLLQLGPECTKFL
jgi:hypothetical protein